MESPHNLGGNYWGTLINPDKSPAPLLEQLCIGLANLMVKLENGNGSADLTPDKLARFYREVGGNYDSLFLETKGPALSFIYQSLGCFHTLQPTTNPFEPPSVPALLPTGFVRWQVINLLLCPDEYAQYLQAAVNRWDVPNPSGGTFPKVIPREAFPNAPDKDMVQWHETVSQRLQRDHADQTTSRRHSPAEFVRYYSAATGARKQHHTPEDYFYYKENHRFQDGTPTSTPRNFSDQAEDIRPHRRHRSPEGRTWRARIFGDSSDRPNSRTSSPNPNLSPKQAGSPASAARVPMRSKTMRARNRDLSPERKSSYRKHRSMTSSESSNNDDALFPRRRHGSIDEHRNGRSYLSPGAAREPRRHSHDATSPVLDGRDREFYHKVDRSPPKPRRYMAPKTKFHENIFDETPRPTRAADQPLPYEINPNIPRVHVKYDGTPADIRVTKPSSGNRGDSGSSGSERARSSSDGSGEAGWKRRNSPSRAAGRKISVHE